jgi:mono/diheme cytochrome c family protein
MKTCRAPLPFAIAATLAACSPAAPGGASPSGSAPPASEQTAADSGARIYSGSCVACHQQNARGIPGVYPSLVGSPVLLGDPAPLARWVIEGQRPPFMPAGRYPTAMPQFGWMKDRDAAALFSYLRSNFGNSAPPVSAATIAEALGNGG